MDGSLTSVPQIVAVLVMEFEIPPMRTRFPAGTSAAVTTYLVEQGQPHLRTRRKKWFQSVPRFANPDIIHDDRHHILLILRGVAFSKNLYLHPASQSTTEDATKGPEVLRVGGMVEFRDLNHKWSVGIASRQRFANVGIHGSSVRSFDLHRHQSMQIREPIDSRLTLDLVASDTGGTHCASMSTRPVEGPKN